MRLLLVPIGVRFRGRATWHAPFGADNVHNCSSWNIKIYVPVNRERLQFPGDLVVPFLKFYTPWCVWSLAFHIKRSTSATSNTRGHL